MNIAKLNYQEQVVHVGVFMLEPVSDVMTEFIIDSDMDGEQLIDHVSELRLNSEQFMQLYEKCYYAKRTDVLFWLMQKREVIIHWHVFINEINQIKDHTKLSNYPQIYPVIEFTSFDEMLCALFFKSSVNSIRAYRKRVGIGCKKYGTAFVNNLIMLGDFFCIEHILDKAITLDHSFSLPYETYSSVYCHKIILSVVFREYSFQRTFMLLISIDVQILDDTIKMINELEGYDSNFINRLPDILPRKPKSFLMIHDTVLIYYMQLKMTDSQNRKLAQQISYLDGNTVFEYTINVPKTERELHTIGQIMHHCVAVYADKIIEKKSQILSLTKDGSIQYTVELTQNKKGWEISQFKGRYNNGEMEGEKGEQYRCLIKKLLC